MKTSIFNGCTVAPKKIGARLFPLRLFTKPKHNGFCYSWTHLVFFRWFACDENHGLFCESNVIINTEVPNIKNADCIRGINWTYYSWSICSTNGEKMHDEEPLLPVTILVSFMSSTFPQRDMNISAATERKHCLSICAVNLRGIYFPLQIWNQ